jgi:DNA-binding transcriptional LysR family regulator
MPTNPPVATMAYSLKGIENFVRTAERGSFAKAAIDLGVTPVAVSDNISRLERSLGVRLFARSTRQLQLTPEGRVLLEQCTKPLRELDQACRETASSNTLAQGLVRVTMVSAVGHLYVVPQLPQFFARYPGISLDLDLNDETMGLIAQRFDVSIRVGQLNDAAFVARPLGPLRLPMVASPAYIAAHGQPLTLEDLTQHVLLQHAIPGRELRFWLAKEVEASGARLRILQLPARLVLNDPQALLRACLDGVGIAQLPLPLVLPALRNGSLQVLLPHHAPDDLQIYLYYPSRKQLPARVRAFVDFVVEGLAQHPDLMADVPGAQPKTTA